MKRRSLPHSFARAGTLVLVLANILGAGRAVAQQADQKIQARTLFDTALELMKQGTYTEDVCGKLEASQKLDPALGTQFYWAECLEHTGKLASAWSMYLDVAEQASGQNLPQQNKFARERADALKTKLTRLIVVVPEDLRTTSGLVVVRDTVTLAPAQWGIPLPVDGGKHTISVSATGRRQWSTTVEAPSGAEGATITVTVPGLQAEPEVGPVGGRGPGTSAPKQGGWTGQHTVGVVAAGAGLVGLGFMAGLGADGAQKHAASREHCSNDRKYCDEAGLDLEKQAHASASASNISLALGAGLLVSGVLVFVLAPSPFGARTAAGTGGAPLALRLSAGPQSAGATLQGAF
jgi:hypothetical protein